MKMKLMAQLFLLLFTVLFYSCGTTEPGIKGLVTIEPGDVSCIESWLIIETSDVSLPTELKLYRDNIPVQTKQITENKTVLYDSLLTPNRTYKYKAKLAGLASEEITVTTLDTTNHDFAWETYTFGTETSTLFDVAIIDPPAGEAGENNIWAVGEIYTSDDKYNAVHWDGDQWILNKLQFLTFCNQSHTSPYPARSIFAFSENDILITSGSQITKFNGTQQESIECIPVSVNKIWGRNSEDLYVAGNEGNLAYYDGTSWEKIETGTNTKLTDIYGDKEGNNVFITGYVDFKPTVLLKYSNNNIEKVIENNDTHANTPGYISGIIESVWLYNNKLYTLTNYDLYISGIDTDGKGRSLWGGNPDQWGVSSVRGNGVNDIITCGIRGRIWHYNGVSWKIYEELLSETDRLRKVAIKGDICAAIGYRYINGVERYGLIHIGRRN